jgi:hypothetical protein
MMNDNYTTIGDLRNLMSLLPDDRIVFIGIPEEDNRCYHTEFEVREADVWLGKVVVLAPTNDEEDDTRE